MYRFSIICVSLLIVSGASADFDWEFGNWSPILGRCKTCERGRLISLQRNPKQLHRDLAVGESRTRQIQSSGNKFSLVPADVYPLETRNAVESDTNKVQLVYLPEGSINDLRSARLVKVKEGVGRIQLRPVRAASQAADIFRNAPLDMETSGSTVSFREISPRRPTALVAERGREREAREQIQLLEAALNSQPNNVRAGELPRVFIAPTHLAPPPGYVKIPLLPSENHVGNKKVLPGTFLTSEVHRQLPPGFVQVPLPERVAVLSHGIPFVNPETNPQLQSQLPQQSTHQNIPQNNEAQNFIRGDQRPGQFRGQTHDLDRGQPAHVGLRGDSFNRGQSAPENTRAQSIQPEFDRGQQFQQDTRRRPQSQRDFNRPVQEDFSRRQPEQQTIHRGRPEQQFGGQQRNEVSPGQAANFNAGHINVPVETKQESFPQPGTSEHLTPPRINEQPASENIPKTDVRSNTDQSPFRKEQDPFGDYGPSSGKSSNSFDDYSFHLPDYEQIFDVYDNPDFDFPNIISEPETEAPVPPTESPATSNQEIPLQEEKEQSIQSDHIDAVTELQSNTEVPVTLTPVLETTLETEPTFNNIPFKLSPRPVQSIPTLSPKPVESFPDQTENIASVQSATVSPTNIRLSPKPLDLIGTPVVQTTQDQTVRANPRRRLRPGQLRGRLPNRHRLNLKPTETPATVEPAVERLNAIPATASPSLLRPRPNLGVRRRRPESSPTEANQNEVTTTASTSTLFPPFAVAKKLHEKPQVPAVEQQPLNRRREGSVARGRFGSRLRPRVQGLGDDNNAQVIADNNLATDQGQTQGSQRRRIRTRGRGRRLRGPNGRPLGKRRRVLSRVRKINPEAQNNRLNAENELRVAESARVLLSRAPVNQVADPIAQTLKLISSKGEKAEEDSAKEKLPKNKLPAGENVEQSSTGKGEDIFHLLNFDNLKQASTASSNLDQKEKNAESSISSIRVSTEGYVNNDESISESKAFVEPIDAEILSHDSTPVEPSISEVDSDPSNPSFDSFINSISSSIAPTPSALTSNKISQNQLKHLTPESTSVTEIVDTLPNTFDKFDNTFGTLLPEDSPNQDNVYSDYDNEQIDANNTYLGSSAHIVYAVALSDEPLPESSTAISETTNEPSEQEISISTTEPNLFEIDTQSILSSLLGAEEDNGNFVTDQPEDTTTYSQQLDSDTIDITVTEEHAGPDTKPINEVPSLDSKLATEESTDKAIEPKEESELNSEAQPEPEPEPEPNSVKPEPELSDDITSRIPDSTTDSESLQNDEALSGDITTTDQSIIEQTIPLDIEEHATTANPTKQQFPTNIPDTKAIPTDKPKRKSLAEALAERLRKSSKQTTTPQPTNSFLDNFFSSSKKDSKNAVNDVTNTDETVIGKSTITEVRASQPVVCIEGNCVNVVGGGIRKR